MAGNTNHGPRPGTHRAVCPTPAKDIREEPAMQELKRLVADLSVDRVHALHEYLEAQEQELNNN